MRRNDNHAWDGTKKENGNAKPTSDAIQVEIEPSLSDDALEEILRIAQERAALFGDLKQALLQGNAEMIKRVAARLCGVDDVPS